MNLTANRQQDAMVVSVHEPRIDAAGAVQFKDQAMSLIQEGQGRVILDLGKVQFLDSSGLGAIVAILKLMPDGRKLELAALQPAVQKVFRLTRMDTVFVIHDKVEPPSADVA